MNRKNFLRNFGLGVLSGSILMNTACNEDDNAQAAEDCKLTGTDDLGPFFVTGSSNIVNINTKNLPGTPMQVTGIVYSGEGTGTPVSGAKIEIWHADQGGVYHPEGSGDVSNYQPEQITLRGYVLTEADGSYAFRSIRPGLYGSRARHIHYKITVAGHNDLVTQSYFEGDNRITEDELSRNAGTCRIVAFTDDGNGGIVGTMNFNLTQS